VQKIHILHRKRLAF